MNRTIIRNGTVFDGLGNDPVQADVAIEDARIVAVGKGLSMRAEGSGEEIDATGLLVTPGFLDVHTHYDAQVTWSNQITPSSWNGVTTAMIGNCGVGFAPCHPDQRHLLVELMEGVEDIPEVVLSAGLPWAWESFGDYLDFLGARRFDLDVATQVPHAALRVYVMGERGANREPATEADRQQMAALAVEGVRAGALGFSTSRTLNHRTVDGRLIPTLDADEAELGAIADGLGSIDSGWIQVISDFKALDDEFAMLRRLTERAGRPLAITVLQRDAEPRAWRTLLDHIGDARSAGLPMLGQVISRPTGVLLGFELSLNPFVGRPSWDAIAALPFTEKLERLRDPEFRKRLVAEHNPRKGLAARVAGWDRIFPFGDPPEYEPAPEQSVAAIAAREQRDPADVAYDLLLE